MDFGVKNDAHQAYLGDHNAHAEKNFPNWDHMCDFDTLAKVMAKILKCL